jgi:hypothetical protein
MQKIDTSNWDSLGALKRIDFKAGQFEANGKTYYLETRLPIGRYCEFVILQRELQMGMTLEQIYEAMITQRELLNKVRFADAAVHADKLLNHMVKLKEKEPTMLKICTLCVNTKEEDRTQWGNDTVVQKLEDWKRAGIDTHDFFAIALIIVPGFTELYTSFTQNILEKMEVAQTVINAALEMSPRGNWPEQTTSPSTPKQN